MTGCAEKEDCREKVGRRVGLKRREEAICPVSRQRDPERAKAREVFGLERSLSCRRAALGWRAKLDFRRGEPLDDRRPSSVHRSEGSGKGRGSLRWSKCALHEAVVVPLPRAESTAGGA